jgi:hypothetical protein
MISGHPCKRGGAARSPRGRGAAGQKVSTGAGCKRRVKQISTQQELSRESL